MDSSFNICCVCNKSMNDPRLLPCSHSFCLQCLETSTISKESSKCPTCQMDFEMPKGGLKDLKTNEFISKFHEIQQGSSNEESCKVCNQNQAIRFCVDCSLNLCASCLNYHKQFQGTKDHQLKAIKRKHEKVERCHELKQSLEICDSCFKNQAAKYCIDCSYNYCLSCLDYHKQFPGTKNHQITELDAKPGKVENKKTDYEVCGDHGEIMNLFCFDCNNILCGMCMNLKHIGHKISHISCYFTDMKKRLDDDINAKELNLQAVACNQESSENFKNENKRRAKELKNEIERRGEEMKKTIDSVVEELKKNVDEKLKEYNKEADDVLLKLENFNKNINAHIETLKQQLNDLKDKKFIETSTLKTKFENIPKYEEYFNFTLSRQNEIKSIFGSIIGGRTETTYQFTVNISSMNQNYIFSPEFYVRQLPWCLRIYPYVLTNDADSKKYLSIHLFCNRNSNLKNWSCKANFKFKLLSNKPDKNICSVDGNAIFINDPNKNGWGRIKFVKMDELLDPNNGYVKDGSVTFEVYVKADEPKGV